MGVNRLDAGSEDQVDPGGFALAQVVLRAVADTGRNLRRQPNWVGLTKIDTTTKFGLRATLPDQPTWPSCKAPMVGTRPIRLPLHREPRET